MISRPLVWRPADELGDSDRNELSNVVPGAHSPAPDVRLWQTLASTATVMANRTNASIPYTSYEYYLDYLDLIPVDEKKLRANKHSIVITFWVSLATFVVLLFLILLYMSWSGSPQMRHSPQPHRICPWSHSLNLPFCLRRASPQTTEEPGSRTGSEQWLQQHSPSASPLEPGLEWGFPGHQLTSGTSKGV
ncbi:melanocortin-2 receptor accessory protein [Peromyscus eremicus]|uniref:melanocortin-2 receptor accessory protein n=1 Tax=Peromyscus eremicus TaxID=42410 RepID=UPI0027DBEA5C|nr:melanocortin-2 receptor accessory protein [Peromyscus eremicus]